MLHIEVVYATPARQTLLQVELEPGATVADALAAVAGQAPFRDLDMAQHALGIYGRLCDARQPLRDGDRVEIYRELLMDAKTARQRRATRQSKQRREQT